MPRRALPGPLDASEEARDGTEWGVFGVPGSLHGARGFSPLRTSLPIRAFSFPGATERRCGFRRGHRLSPQPVYLGPPFALRRGVFLGSDVSRFYRADRMFRGRGFPSSLGRFARLFRFACRHPWFFRSTGEGRIPSGRYPLVVAAGFGKL